MQFTLPKAGQVKLELFDLLGRKIATLKEGYQPAGTHATVLDNKSLPAGVYFVKLKAGDFSQVQKLILLK
ncbi:MAG TPA: T9SS type A sorting domain-containing protein [bacterium]